MRLLHNMQLCQPRDSASVINDLCEYKRTTTRRIEQ